MKKIIVGIDFSKGSICAIEIAIDIANKLNNDILLVYVKSNITPEEYTHEEISQKLEESITKYQSKLYANRIGSIIVEGKVAQELSKQAKKHNATMIIVGTHGMSGYKKDWIGRNAYKTIEETECPVLTIREGFNFNKQLEKIVLPIDSCTDTRQKVPFAIKMAHVFNSKIYILGLYSSESVSSIVDKYVEQVEKFLKNANIEFNAEKMLSENITSSTLEYAEKINADLIVIMIEQEKKFSNIILGSYAQQMIHQSMIPVLTIHTEDINSASR